jgi:hypothetical protein
MEEETVKKKIELVTKIIQRIEKIVFFASLPFVILLILPVPWANFELGRGVAIYFASGTLISLEIVKFLLTGKVSIYKSRIDNSLIWLALLLLLSIIISQDVFISLLGFSYSIGSGGLYLLTSIAYFYSFRSFFKEESELELFIKYFIIICGVGALISCFSFFHVNIGSMTDILEKLFSYGSAFFDNAMQMEIIWIVLFVLSLGFVLNINNRKRLSSYLPVLVASVIFLIAITLFSFVIGNKYLILLFLAILFLGMIMYGVKGLNEKFNKRLMISYLVVVLILNLIYFIPSIRSFFEAKNNFKNDGIVLDMDSSWQVATKSLTRDVRSGIFGTGYDTYSNNVNRFLPVLSFSADDTDTFSSQSEILKIIVQSGLVGLLLYIFVIVTIIKTIYKDFLKIKSKIAGIQYIQAASAAGILLIVVSSVFQNISSFVYLILFALICIYVLSKAVASSREAESFVIEVDFLTESISKKKSQFVPIIAISLAALFLLAVCYFVGSTLSSSVSVLKAEYQLKTAQDKLAANNLTNDQIKTELNKVIDLYVQSINSTRWNYVLYRRVSVLYIEYVKILETDYKQSASQVDKDSILKEITRYAGNAVDTATKSTDISHTVPKNWLNRVSIYNDLVSVGFNSYLPQAIDSVNGAKDVSPYNNVIYYYEAQFDLLEAKPKDAADALKQSLYLNPTHIPSLVLSGDLEYGNKNWAASKDYYDKATDLLIKYGGNGSDLYKSIQARRDELSKLISK